jgi:hypothetical protein
VEDIEGKLARQGTDVGQARRALTITVEQVQAAIPNDAVIVEYVRYQSSLGKETKLNQAMERLYSLLLFHRTGSHSAVPKKLKPRLSAISI